MHDPLIHFPAAAMREGPKEKGPNQTIQALVGITARLVKI
jgi:hypothetical protein